MKPIRLSAREVEALAAVRASGHIRHFSLAGRSHDEPRKWNLGDTASTIKSISGREPLCFDLLVNERQVSIGAWSSTWDVLEPWIQQWQLFNPHLLEYRPQHSLPALKPGCHVQLFAGIPFRATKYPIETRFGANGEEGQQSPLVQFLNGLPIPQAGSLLYIQVLWRRDPTPFSLSFLPHWDILGHGRNPEALAEKKAERYTYQTQIRGVVIHESLREARRLDLARAAGEAFRLWDRPNANRIVPKHFSLLGRAGALHLLTAVWARRFAWGWESHFHRKPHYTKDELAAVVHPPPPGANVLRIPRQDISADAAPHAMVDLNNDVRRDYQAWLRRSSARPASSGTAALDVGDVRSALARSLLYRVK